MRHVSSKGVGTVTDTACDLCGGIQYTTRYNLKEFKVVCCKECGLLSVRAQGGDVDPKEMYDEEYYRERVDYYFHNPITDPQAGVENQNILDFKQGLSILEEYKSPHQSKLLDVGCALGIFLYLAKQKGWDTNGIDVSKYATDYARKTFGINAMCGVLTEMRLPDKEFDVITLWDVFEHFQDPSRQLKEIHRILKDDGIVLLDTPNAEALIRRIAHVLYWASLGTIAYPAQKLHHVFHLYYFSRETARRMVEKSGFKIVWVRGKPIPLIKARGTKAERLIVKAFSLLEAKLDMQYEILMLLQKAS